MKILVCFKVVRDVDYILKDDWVDIANDSIDWLYVKSILNCYDEGALENALRLKDLLIKNNIECKIDAITSSEMDTDLFDKHLLAAGYDKVTVLKKEQDYFNPTSNAKMIYDYIKDENYDLVITGYENAIGNNGVFPYRLASLLNYPVLSHVSDFEYNNNIIATVDLEDELIKYEIPIKSVLIFKNTENSSLRFPTLMERLKAKDKEENIISVEKEYKDNYDTKVIKTYHLEENTVTKYIDGTTQIKVESVLKEVENE